MYIYIYIYVIIMIIMCIYVYTYIYIYIYIYMSASRACSAPVHPVSVRRFPSCRTQPLENLTPLPMNKWISEQPSPWRKSCKRESCYGDRV